MEEFWRIIELNTGIIVPKYLKNILMINGYDDAASIESITTQDIDSLEQLVKNDMDDYFGQKTDSDRPRVLGHINFLPHKKDKFKIPRGDCVKLMKVVEFVKYILASEAGFQFFYRPESQPPTLETRQSDYRRMQSTTSTKDLLTTVSSPQLNPTILSLPDALNGVDTQTNETDGKTISDYRRMQSTTSTKDLLTTVSSPQFNPTILSLPDAANGVDTQINETSGKTMSGYRRMQSTTSTKDLLTTVLSPQLNPTILSFPDAVNGVDTQINETGGKTMNFLCSTPRSSKNDVSRPTADNMDVGSQGMRAIAFRLSKKNEIADLSATLMRCSVKIVKLQLDNDNPEIDTRKNSKTILAKVLPKSATQRSSKVSKTTGKQELKRRFRPPTPETRQSDYRRMQSTSSTKDLLTTVSSPQLNPTILSLPDAANGVDTQINETSGKTMSGYRRMQSTTSTKDLLTTVLSPQLNPTILSLPDAVNEVDNQLNETGGKTMNLLCSTPRSSKNDVSRPTADNMDVGSQGMRAIAFRLSKKNEIADLSATLMRCSVKIVKLQLDNDNPEIDTRKNSKTILAKVLPKSATQRSSKVSKTTGKQELKRRFRPPTPETRQSDYRRMQSTSSTKDLLTTVSSPQLNPTILSLPDAANGVDTQINETSGKTMSGYRRMQSTTSTKDLLTTVSSPQLNPTILSLPDAVNEVDNQLNETGGKTMNLLCSTPRSSKNDVSQPTADNMDVVSQGMRAIAFRLSKKNEIADLSATLMRCSVKIVKLNLDNYNPEIDTRKNSKTVLTKVHPKSATRRSSKVSKTTGKLKLKRRLRKMLDQKRTCCVICEKTFSTLRGINQHMLIHSVKRPLSCAVCNRAFRQLSHLLQHQKIHTGEKPYSCQVCGKKFRQFSHLQVHLRIHTGEKPYECEICIHSFRQRANLIMHNKRHTGVKNFFCAHCEISFFQKWQLKHHLHKSFEEKDHNFQCRFDERSN